MFRSGNSRQKQISDLRKQCPLAKALTPQQDVWDITVQTRFGPLSYRVILHPRFPEYPPEIKLLVQATHRWVDHNLRVIGHPKLQRWSKSNSLGAICKSISTEFATNPPAPKVSPMPGPGRPDLHLHPNRPPALNRPASPMPISQNNLSPQPDNRNRGHSMPLPGFERKVSNDEAKVEVPEVPSQFPELDALSTFKLEQLLEDDVEFKSFVNGLDCAHFFRTRDELYESTYKLAQDNLKHKEAIDALKEQIAEQRSILTATELHYKDLRAKQRNVAGTYTPASVAVALGNECERLDEESDRLRKDFLNEDIKDLDFVKQYKKKRRQYHSSAALKERLQIQAQTF